MAMKVSLEKFKPFYTDFQYNEMVKRVEESYKTLYGKTGRGNDFLGWLDLPSTIDKTLVAKINETANKIKEDSEVLVVIGIGGSYLGARSAIEFLKSPNYNIMDRKGCPQVFFVGNNISADHLAEVFEIIGDRDYSVNVISKSGTTIEPALAFHFFEADMKKKYGDDWAKRVYCTTDAKRGDLRPFADKHGCVSFIVPDDIGGRFSVLSPVGLLPIACAGIDIEAILEGALAMEKELATFSEDNIAVKYAVARNLAYENGKVTEIIGSYEPRFKYVGEWWKQLFGESEGKEYKGLLPASVDLTADLHSLGQYMQEGLRNFFETIVHIEKTKTDYKIEDCDKDFSRLELFEGTTLTEVNKMALDGTVVAHTNGGVPNVIMTLPGVCEKAYGEMVYFFELSCGLSAYTLGVNPFDQPGVEAYKKEIIKIAEGK